eukprot:COSAG02_NODE_23021_length_732_cov_1.203791_2_plen_34_part_01
MRSAAVRARHSSYASELFRVDSIGLGLEIQETAP